MLRSSEIEAITEWHWSMATIFEFICYHVHVARWLRKWPKWAIGQLRQLSRAPDMSGNVRTTWISDDIRTCPEKKLWNSVSGKYRTSLHLVRALHRLERRSHSGHIDNTRKWRLITCCRLLCRELVCITVKWTWYNGRDIFFHITSGRINTWKGVNQLKELFFLNLIFFFFKYIFEIGKS